MKDIFELMEKVNCKKWPEEWNPYFEKAKKQYEENGCIYAEEAYYDMLEHKYGIFGEYLPVYKQAANAVKGDKAFELFLVFMSIVLNEREAIKSEINGLAVPVSPENKDDIKYDMLTGLAICSQADLSYKNLLKRGYPEDVVDRVMKLPINGLKGFMLRHNGNYGYDSISWFQRAIDGTLIPFLYLQLEVGMKFYADAVVLKNDKGETIALATDQEIHSSGHILGAKFFEEDENSWFADYKETDTDFIGYPYDECGLVKKEKLTLNKKEWHVALKKGDPVVALHIPADSSLKKEYTDEFFEVITKFMKDMGYEYKAITVGSWLMDSQLEEILDENSNILDFQRRFKKIGVRSQGLSVFRFVFRKPNANFEIKELPEDTSLQRKIKERYLNNKAIYEAIGYIIREK